MVRFLLVDFRLVQKLRFHRNKDVVTYKNVIFSFIVHQIDILTIPDVCRLNGFRMLMNRVVKKQLEHQSNEEISMVRDLLGNGVDALGFVRSLGMKGICGLLST